jgi:hypothetical protein
MRADPMNCTKEIFHSHKLVATLIFFSLSLLFTHCVPNNTSITVDRNNPEIVLRSYFIAWEKGDWEGQRSMMDEKYIGMAPEPAKKIDIISISPISSYSKEDRYYRVIFDIEVVGEGVSMHTGRYDWNYYLRWNKISKSWLIINYGVG